ncbi:MAG: radical SAM protein [Candidatus Cryptobacteroides sp.]
MKLTQLLYLPLWWFRAKFLGRKQPLQSVIFISDRCNLSCKHCSVYNHKSPLTKTYEQVKEELEYCYSLGSRFVDFEGGEPFLWEDQGRRVDDLCELARKIGFFSCTITTNAQLPFPNSKADSIWVSLDGVGEYHERVRGKGTFERLEKNVASSGHPALSANMAINTLNVDSVEAAIQYVKDSPYFQKISLNFHTPFPGTESLALSEEKRKEVIDLIISYKKKHYPIMNSISGLKYMRDLNFKKVCWMSNFIFTDGTRSPECAGSVSGVCDKCGFCMAGEERAVMNLKPDTVVAGMNLRVKK